METEFRGRSQLRGEHSMLMVKRLPAVWETWVRSCFCMAMRKGWERGTLCNLDGEDHAAERTVEDVFLRKFMLGTFPGCLADQLILKRWANQVEICALVLRQLPPHKFYFLVGYSETLLSHFYKCPVRLHLQTVPSKVVYKYI
ncbi:hypothetical protein FD755_010611 [Muntiacus reevesi]|uniref:28S ribosomal protein S24, mitochondrial n=2 Tax=Muntiacus TaxID=9885 RepID=A0A5N3XZ05_MUNRE|nr:hypothetical protein FD754_007987 [Muntiacus muntjak]KAB0379033.1 hypothetical protein FD755_010611 [Muntiacus reevesi]